MTQETEAEKVNDEGRRGNSQKRRKHPWWFRVARTLGISYVVIIVLMVLLEERLLFPGAYLNLHTYRPVENVGDFEYHAVDGSTITGRLLERPGANRTILFLHGNGIRVRALDSWVAELSEALNANVLAAEYRGFQSKHVTPSEANVISDALSAHDALSIHFGVPPEDIVVYGRSLGGGCAAAVASRRRTKYLVLDRTFDSAVHVAARKYWMFPVRKLMKNEFDSVHRLNDFDGRVFQLHGDADRVVPIEHGRRLYETIRSSEKQFLEIPGLGHNDRLSGEVLRAIGAFVEFVSPNEDAVSDQPSPDHS